MSYVHFSNGLVGQSAKITAKAHCDKMAQSVSRRNKLVQLSTVCV